MEFINCSPRESESGGTFHDRSTKGLHRHNFDLDIILSIGLSRALKSMVPSRDLKRQRFWMYSLGHFCVITLQGNSRPQVPKPLEIIQNVTIPFLIVMSCAIFWLSQIFRTFESFFLMTSYFFLLSAYIPCPQKVVILWPHFRVGSSIER